MAKKVHDDVLDGAWNIIKNNCDKITVCEGEPASFAEANTAKGSGGKALADVTASGTDFTLADGDASGRKVTVAAKNSVPVDDTGNADHVALLDTSNSKLLYVTTCTTKALTSGDSVNIPAWDAEIADPT